MPKGQKKKADKKGKGKKEDKDGEEKVEKKLFEAPDSTTKELELQKESV